MDNANQKQNIYIDTGKIDQFTFNLDKDGNVYLNGHCILENQDGLSCKTKDRETFNINNNSFKKEYLLSLISPSLEPDNGFRKKILSNIKTILSIGGIILFTVGIIKMRRIH